MAEFAQTTINKMNQFYSRWAPRVPSEVTPRNVLIFCVIALLCLGSIMVASASMPYAERLHENSFHYVLRHGISIAVAGVLAYGVYRVPLNVWFNNTFPLWILTIYCWPLCWSSVRRSMVRPAGFVLRALRYRLLRSPK